MLDKCDGPTCPRCGCRDSEIRVEPSKARIDPELFAKFGVNSWFAGGRARCKHCGLVFSFRELPPQDNPNEDLQESEPDDMVGAAALLNPPASSPATTADSSVRYPVRACPECDGDDIKVTSTRRPVRHHKCGGCGAKFKSIERAE